MIDFHTYFLSWIDDGSHRTEMMKEILGREAETSVTYVYAISHFYTHCTNIGRIAESFLKFGPKRHFCMNLLRQELGRVIIGSDCHNLTSRAPNLGQAMEYIEKKAGADTARSIEETEKKLLWQHM